MLNVMRNRETQMSDIYTALSKINSQMLALREDAFGQNTNVPNLKTAKDKVLAQERLKKETTLARESSINMSITSDEEYTQSNGYIFADSRQDSLADNAIDETSNDGDDKNQQVEPEVKASDDEECIICDDESEKM